MEVINFLKLKTTHKYMSLVLVEDQSLMHATSQKRSKCRFYTSSILFYLIILLENKELKTQKFVRFHIGLIISNIKHIG